MTNYLSDLYNKDIQSVIGDRNIEWDKIVNSNVLVTGATGLIGSGILRILLRAISEFKGKGKVIAFVRNPKKLRDIIDDNDNLIVIEGDILNPLICDKEVHYIIHCASLTKSGDMIHEPLKTLFTAAKGTENVLDLAKEKRIDGMVFTSSMEVYGAVTQCRKPLTENELGFINLNSPRSCYPEGKRYCELLCNCFFYEHGIPVTSARLAQTFGVGVPLQDNRVFMQFARSVINGENIVLHTKGKSISNFCYITDTIRGILLLLTKGKRGEAYNVCFDEESKSISEIAETVAALNDHVSVVYDIPETNVFGYAPDTLLKLDSGKLRGLGWKPSVNLIDSYKRLIDYLKAADDEYDKPGKV